MRSGWANKFKVECYASDLALGYGASGDLRLGHFRNNNLVRY